MKDQKTLRIASLLLAIAALPNLASSQQLLPGPEKNSRAAAPNGLGVKRVAVILFNWADSPTQPVTKTTVRRQLLTDTDSTNSFFKKVSFDQLSLTGDVFGWYTLPVTGRPNEKYVPQVVPTLNMLAGRNGFNATNYDAILYTYPAIPGPWAGQAFGGKKVEMNGWNRVVAAHEIFHVLGIDHANGLNCSHRGNRVAIGDDWASAGYGDPFCIQGKPATQSIYRHPNAYFKARMGWFKTFNLTTVPGRTSRTYTYFIRPLELSTTGLQCVRVPVPASRIPMVYPWDPNPSLVDLYYYLEYRRPSQFDTFNATDPVVNGVSIRLCTDIDTNHMTLLVDTQPATAAFADAPLTAGRTFTDPVTGVTIRTVRTNSSWAEVQVTVQESATTSVGPHLLWTQTDGTASLWTLNGNGDYLRHRYFGPYPDMQALGYQRLNLYQARMLWSRSDGLAKLWVLDRSDNVGSVKTYGPFSDWTARSYHSHGGTPRLLWSRTNGMASLWTLNSNDDYVTHKYFGPYAGWTARSYQKVSSSMGKMLWSTSSGRASIWTMDGADRTVSKKYYGPYAGWTATDYERLPDGTARLVWTHTNGQVNVWSLNGWDDFTGFKPHGPHSHWSAHDFSAK